jgi:hypothetical protein
MRQTGHVYNRQLLMMTFFYYMENKWVQQPRENTRRIHVPSSLYKTYTLQQKLGVKSNRSEKN